MKPFRIFRPGTHTAACGTSITFTEEDLKRAVAAYDPKLYAAPLVIGHPKMEDRAYGWAERLTYEDGHVVAHPDHVEPKFGEAVEAKAFRNRSAAWYMPDHPNNPSPGNLYPKHIGFLGAVPPALKGLGDIQFAAEEHPDKVVEFADMSSDDRWTMASVLSTTARTLRALKNFLIADKGQEAADEILPEWDIEDPQRQAIRLEEQARQASKAETPAYSETPTPTRTEDNAMTPAEIEAMKKENERLAAREREFSERENSLKAAEHIATVAAINASLEPLVKAGKVLPAERQQLAAFMATLDDKEQVVEFGEAPEGGQVPKVSPRKFMQDFLAKRPKAVDFSERAGKTGENGGAMSPRQLADKATAKITEAAKEGRVLSYTEAVNAVLDETGATVEDPTSAPNV